MTIKERIIGFIESTIEQMKLGRLEKKHGFLAECPWCRQTAQDGPKYRCDKTIRSDDLEVFVIRCGVCMGKSLWMLGDEAPKMTYVNAFDGPDPSFQPLEGVEIEDAWISKDAIIDHHKTAWINLNRTVCQNLAAGMRYPRFMDDQENFPGTTEADGYVIGDDDAWSMSEMAANRIRQLELEIAAIRSA
jgi:hypothetical protein